MPRNEEVSNTLLIIKTDDIGDYLLWRHVLPIIKKKHSQKIVFIGNLIWKDLFEWLDKSFVDEALWLDKKRWHDVNYRKEWYEKVNKLAPEITVNPMFTRNYRIDDLLMYASQAPERIAWDFKLQRGLSAIKLFHNLSTLIISSNQKLIHEFYRNSEFVEKWLGDVPEIIKPNIEIENIKKEKDQIIMFPGANANSRKWKSEYVIKVGEYLLNKGCKILILGGPNDSDLCQLIENKLNNQKVINKCGQTTLPQLVELIAFGELIITNDTGALHMAVSVGTPAICISNGFHYTRFTDYRNFPFTNVRTFVPSAFERKYVAKGILAEKNYYTSQEINEIKPEVVIKSLELKWWKAPS